MSIILTDTRCPLITFTGIHSHWRTSWHVGSIPVASSRRSVWVSDSRWSKLKSAGKTPKIYVFRDFSRTWSLSPNVTEAGLCIAVILTGVGALVIIRDMYFSHCSKFKPIPLTSSWRSVAALKHLTFVKGILSIVLIRVSVRSRSLLQQLAHTFVALHYVTCDVIYVVLMCTSHHSWKQLEGQSEEADPRRGGASRREYPVPGKYCRHILPH